jgi:hypothetical protein
MEDEIQQKRKRRKGEGGRHIERVKKKLLLCQQIRFGFGSPVHHITPN